MMFRHLSAVQVSSHNRNEKCNRTHEKRKPGVSLDPSQRIHVYYRLVQEIQHD